MSYFHGDKVPATSNLTATNAQQLPTPNMSNPYIQSQYSGFYYPPNLYYQQIQSYSTVSSSTVASSTQIAQKQSSEASSFNSYQNYAAYFPQYATISSAEQPNMGYYNSYMTACDSTYNSQAPVNSLSAMKTQKSKSKKKKREKPGKNSTTQLLGSSKPDMEDYECETCKCVCLGLRSYTAHLAGKKHKSRLEQLQKFKILDHTKLDSSLNPSSTNESTQVIKNLETNEKQTNSFEMTSTFKLPQERMLENLNEIEKLLQNKEQQLKSGEQNQIENTQNTSNQTCSNQVQPQVNFKNIGEQSELNKAISQDSTGTEFLKQLNRRVVTMQTIVLKCRTCEITTVGVDSYKAHINGLKHNRFQYMKTKMGEPVFSKTPEILSLKVSQTIANKVMEMFSEQKNENLIEIEPPLKEKLSQVADRNDYPLDVFETKPIGSDFVEEVLDCSGKLVCYMCTLCECRFNDTNARDLHLKGKRHRLQYKKKVDPSLLVEFITSDRLKMEKEKKKLTSTLSVNLNPECRIYSIDVNPFESVETSKQFKEIFNYNRFTENFVVPKSSYLISFIDYLLEAKHISVLPGKDFTNYLFSTAFLIDRAIRYVSRNLEKNFIIPIALPTWRYNRKALLKFETILETIKSRTDISSCLTSDFDEKPIAHFVRVARTGILALGTVIQGDVDFEMTVLTSLLPTENLLKVFHYFLTETILNLASKEKQFYMINYKIEAKIDLSKAAIILSINDDVHPEIHFTLTFSSPYIMYQKPELLQQEASDLLDYERTKWALLQVRHYRFFRDKNPKLAFLTFMIRIIRALSLQNKVLSNVTVWQSMVVLERIYISAGVFLTPSSLFRHYFEFFAHGIVMLRGPMIGDPCQVEFPNLFENLSKQNLEDLMFYAQHTIRMIAMRQVHKLLNIDDKEVFKMRMQEVNKNWGKNFSFNVEQNSIFQQPINIENLASDKQQNLISKRKHEDDDSSSCNEDINE